MGNEETQSYRGAEVEDLKFELVKVWNVISKIPSCNENRLNYKRCVGAVFSHLMVKIDFNYFYRIGWE